MMTPLTEVQGRQLYEKCRCPDCDSAVFNMGPSGGSALNIRCANCHRKFWFSPPFTPQRIDNADECYQTHAVNLYEEIFGLVAPPKKPSNWLLRRLLHLIKKD